VVDRDLRYLSTPHGSWGTTGVVRLSTYPGGRGGKECVRSTQRLAPGGGAPYPGSTVFYEPID